MNIRPPWFGCQEVHGTGEKVAYSLRNNGEEAVQDACGHVRIEAGSSRTPSGGSKSHRGKEHQNWQAAEVGR